MAILKFIDAITQEVEERSDAKFSPSDLWVRYGRGSDTGGFFPATGLALSHELQHWSDFCGTGVGAFILAADVVIYDLLFSNLHRERLGDDAQTFAGMIERRVGLFPLFEGPRQEQPRFPIDSALFRIGATFLKQKLVTHVLSGTSGDRWEYRQLPREIPLQVLVWGVCQVFRFEDDLDSAASFEQICRLFPFPPLSIQPRYYWTTELTTSTITECLAVLNETIQHWYGRPRDYGVWELIDLVTPEKMRAALNDSWQFLWSKGGTRYALCLDYAARAWSSLRQTDGVGEYAPSLAACCDLALHAPLPPVLMPERPVNWDDIYPPARFVRLVHAVQRVGLLDIENFPQDAVWNSYCADLLRAAELPEGTPGPLFEVGAKNRLDALSSSDGRPNQPMHLGELLGLVFRAFAAYREHHALGRTFIALAPKPPDAATGSGTLLDDFGATRWFLYPLLQIVKGQAILHPLIPRECTRRAAEFILDRKLMHSIILGAGEFDVSSFPDEVFPNHSDHVNRCLEKLINQLCFPELARWPVKLNRK